MAKLGGEEFIIKPLIGANAIGLVKFEDKNKKIETAEVALSGRILGRA